ncbi:MAG: hypothetical protein JST78_09490 [Bacteroidetes bacterium]|nr:hypothetical protein [Bacteroidota bacterium]
MQVTITTSALPFTVTVSCPISDSVSILTNPVAPVVVSAFRDGIDGNDGLNAFDLWQVDNPGGTIQEYYEYFRGIDGRDARQVWLDDHPGMTSQDYDEYISGAKNWGEIEGDLQNQADLMAAFDLKLNADLVGAALGVTPLGADQKIPTAYFPDEILGNVRFRGTYNGTIVSSAYVSFNGLPLPNPTVSNAGVYFIVTSGFTKDGIDYSTGDWILSLGAVSGWSKVDNSDSVTSVFGRIGNIVAVESDYQSFYVRLSEVYDNPSWIGSLSKAKVGLGNVDNTSDTQKPVSTLQQAALDLKQNLIGFTPQEDMWAWRRKGVFFIEHFLGTNDNSGIGTTLGVVVVTSGTGSVGRTTGTFPNRTIQEGVLLLSTGTTSTGNGVFRLGSNNAPQYYIGNGAISYEVYINIESLSNSTDRFTAIFGAYTAGNVNSTTNGIFFIYDEGGVWGGGVLGASPNWRCVTINTSVRTTTNSAVAISASGWVRLRIEINSAGTSVGFYINDTLVATHTTNIPSTSTAMHWYNLFNKIAGTTSLNMYADYLAYRKIF